MKWERIYIYMCEEDCAKGEAKVGKKLETYCCDSSNMGAFSFLSQIKAAINKPVTKWLWFTYLQPAMFQVLLSSSLLRTRWLAVCSLLAANIKDAHTELISRGHLYNNTFAQSQWCSFDLEQWPILPFVWNMVIYSKWPLDVVHLKQNMHWWPQLNT